MKLLQALQQSFDTHSHRNAFLINDLYSTYGEFGAKVSSIRKVIQENIPETEKFVGLITNDDLETYASILALWFEGKAYVPINPIYPKVRNTEILIQTESRYILDSSTAEYLGQGFNVLSTLNLEPVEVVLEAKNPSPDDLAYVIFTSGSTGVPKGAPITYGNLDSFADAIYQNLSFSLGPTDRCLQMFELTFDMSVVSFLAPLLKGACVYPLSKNNIKYFEIIKLLTQYQLTVLIMVPSIIHFLRPYFKEILSTSVRYSCFAGGKLYGDIAQQWNMCIPNAQIINYYGPTETTIYCGGFLVNKNGNNKHENDVISIGKPFPNTRYLIVDEDGQEVETGETGELCIAGEQLFPGYLKNKEKNREVFFTRTHKGQPHRFYKTGDLCYKDGDGDYLYVGRSDFQVKIRGFRVELGEIEYQVKQKLPDLDLVVIDIPDKLGNMELGLAIRSEEMNLQPVLDHLKETLPPYMVPTQFLFLEQLPHSVNDKIDMKTLRTIFQADKQILN